LGNIQLVILLTLWKHRFISKLGFSGRLLSCILIKVHILIKCVCFFVK